MQALPKASNDFCTLEFRYERRAAAMRVKTDARRRAITAAAWEVFKINGFERTSMTHISERVGGSKATLYSYFASKEELFAAAVAQAIKERADRVLERMDDEGELPVRIAAFARFYLESRLAPEMIEADRVMISEADRSDLSVKLRTEFILPEWQRLAATIAHEMDAGHLRQADPYLVAMHFRGLIEADLLERRLHGEAEIPLEEVEAAAISGAEAFLRAYSTSPRPTGAGSSDGRGPARPPRRRHAVTPPLAG